MQDVGKSLSTKVTAPIVGVGTAAAKMSIDFQDSLAKVSTIVDTTQLSIENVKKGVLNLSNETGEGVNDLNEALYQSISARVESGKSVEFLGSAVKLAKGGFTETSSSVDLLTTIRSEEHTSELKSRQYLVCRLLLEKKNHRVTTDPRINH